MKPTTPVWTRPWSVFFPSLRFSTTSNYIYFVKESEKNINISILDTSRSDNAGWIFAPKTQRPTTFAVVKKWDANYLHGVVAPPGVDRLFVLYGCCFNIVRLCVTVTLLRACCLNGLSLHFGRALVSLLVVSLCYWSCIVWFLPCWLTVWCRVFLLLLLLCY